MSPVKYSRAQQKDGNNFKKIIVNIIVNKLNYLYVITRGVKVQLVQEMGQCTILGK